MDFLLPTGCYYCKSHICTNCNQFVVPTIIIFDDKMFSKENEVKEIGFISKYSNKYGQMLMLNIFGNSQPSQVHKLLPDLPVLCNNPILFLDKL